MNAALLRIQVYKKTQKKNEDALQKQVRALCINNAIDFWHCTAAQTTTSINLIRPELWINTWIRAITFQTSKQMPFNRRWLWEIKPFICPSVLILFSRFFLTDVLPNGFYQDYLHNCPGFDPGVMSGCGVSALFLISHGFLLPERAPTTAGAHFHTAPYYTLRNVSFRIWAILKAHCSTTDSHRGVVA